MKTVSSDLARVRHLFLDGQESDNLSARFFMGLMIGGS